MKKIIKLRANFLFVGLIIAASFFIIGNESPFHDTEYSNKRVEKPNKSSLQIENGKEIYERYCIACHGADGKGDGPEAYKLETKPTDFTSGNIKFKSTPYGTLPVENDIVSTLELGARTTAMLPQLQLSEAQMHDAAAYVISLMPKDEKAGKPIEIGKAPAVNNELLKTGKKLFDVNCVSCHGKDAKGDGPLASKLTDYRQDPIHPADLILRPLKRANTPDRMFMIVSTGIKGTPMPPFQQVLKPKERWAVVDYVESLKSGYVSSGNDGMMGGMMNGMMGGMMRHRFVGEEFKGMRIDMAAARAWMMGNMMGR